MSTLLQSMSSIPQHLSQTPSSSKDPKQPTLYTHLSEFLSSLHSSNQVDLNVLDKFETLSEFCKKYHFQNKQPIDEQQLLKHVNKKKEYPKWLQLQKTLSVLPSINTNQRNIQNFIADTNMFSKVGYSFSKQQTYHINYTLKQLSHTSKAESIRFWGKIQTRKSDYYIIQGTIATKPLPPDTPANIQSYRIGANYNTFWASHNCLDNTWHELPLVTPQQLQIAKTIKYVFTGNLECQVKSYPIFVGQEKHLLKAQIVRITHNCQIAPKGLYTTLEDNSDEIGFAEETKMPEFTELSNLENWSHINPYLLNIGRSSYYVDPKMPEQQREEYLTKLKQTDPKLDRLKPINEDKPVQKMGFEGCWLVKVNGNTQVFSNTGKDQGTTSCYGLVTLRNPHWPGWLTVASMKSYGSIYIGTGIKASQSSFSPISPNDLLIEGEDIDQCYQPNPQNPPDQLQPDSDDQKKKEEEGS